MKPITPHGTGPDREPNIALWLPRPGGRLHVGPAPYTAPGPGEVVVRVRAVAMNPVDALHGLLYRVILPWLAFPAVIGNDVAGEIAEVGDGVTRLRPGDRVLGHAVGVERSRNRPAEGAFQRYVVLMEHLVSPVPDTLPFEHAAVLPLALSTAATGMFQRDHLDLPLPTTTGTASGAEAGGARPTVIVWGGSTSVGSNAVQLACHAGYRVLATASPRNADYLRSLGAAEVIDRHSPAVVTDVLDRIGASPLAGSLAIGAGSLRPAIAVTTRARHDSGPSDGRYDGRRVASVQPGPLTTWRARRARRLGVRVSTVWGSSLKDNEVGPAVYTEFLPAALAAGSYRAAPPATVTGHGLDHIPPALHRLRRGVSATKLVVTL
ncbi:zinc-binding alcohol dehydrogenase family protein [Amycolatopsis sp. PS_44_ISF1]|uniref:zinc-binding alcohol dehydrogenase family protein n=1 Tax=Amycolatopsis sp. PS_44_ISF1 TaxID=2974917 RepID=UPI0028DE5A19|nr:zinc-binding alcohol dehydrogenase family protein [Amycolatopsis sp. PS_44_ISF1]MDT8910031.1 zinc-binding alcohol dehydrogenase family protein [Amycolatopsis sp. PS_44_ISF1]